ncbi:MAG: NupC/NupG family nucleoside CNT transporter [Gammaproteobacteria bacterium]
MEKFTGLIGIVTLLALAYAMSNNRRRIDLRVVIWGLGLQFVFAWFILKTPLGLPLFNAIDAAIRELLAFSDHGADFLFKSFTSGQVAAANLNIAFRVLPTIIFFSSLIAVLYYLRIMQFMVGAIAKAMQKTLGTSGSETLSVAGNIFVGQTEAPLLVAPLIATMTRSELMAMMTGGFATVAGGVMAVYVSLLAFIPGIAGHLLTASVMSAPAALLIAKIIYPETETPVTSGGRNADVAVDDANIIEAITRGATGGMTLALNVAAMLIAFVALVAMLDEFLGLAGLTLEGILGWLFAPLAWTMGVPWREAPLVGSLLGQKMVLTEMIAYINLADILQKQPQALSPKAQIITSYALCGFANFASIGVQIGGIGGIAPSRRKDLSQLGFKAMLAGTLAACLTATIAGLLI